MLTIKDWHVNNRNIGRSIDENEEKNEDFTLETIGLYFNCLFPTCMHWFWLMNNFNN